MAEGIERQHRYVANIRQAQETLRRGNRREVLGLLDECRSLAGEPVHRGIEWDYICGRRPITPITRWKATLATCIAFDLTRRAICSSRAVSEAAVSLFEAYRNVGAKRHVFDDRIEEVGVNRSSSDGSLLAIAGTDGRVVVHRMDDGSIIFDKPVVGGRVYTPSWLGDRLQLVVGRESAVLSIVDPISNAIRRTEPLTASDFGMAHDPQHPIEIRS